MELAGKRILIVDDEPLFLQTTCQLLQNEGASCVPAVDAATALALLEEDATETDEFDLILTDLNMPGNLRWELLQAGRQRWAHVPMIVITGVPSLPSAIESLRLGVTDYLLKPVGFPELLSSIRRALSAASANRQESQSGAMAGRFSQPLDETIVGSCPAMASIVLMVGRIAQSSAHVLISGETGTGKELIARAIHRLSSRSDESFVVADCNALAEDQLASDLFGTCLPDRSVEPGLLMKAQGGSIFLDEVAALPLTFQPKLLRVVQNQELVPVGGKQPQQIDVRFISATQWSMEEATAIGKFRQDLYYRLGVLSLTLPPLRERGADILQLAEHFWKSSRSVADAPLRLSPAASSALLAYPWPGNVRELRNAILLAATMSQNEVVDLQGLPPEIGRSLEHSPSTPGARSGIGSTPAGPRTDSNSEPIDGTFHQLRAESERNYLMQLMENSRGNVTHAARKAKMSRQGFHKLLKRHGLSAAEFRDAGLE